MCVFFVSIRTCGDNNPLSRNSSVCVRASVCVCVCLHSTPREDGKEIVLERRVSYSKDARISCRRARRVRGPDFKFKFVSTETFTKTVYDIGRGTPKN